MTLKYAHTAITHIIRPPCSLYSSSSTSSSPHSSLRQGKDVGAAQPAPPSVNGHGWGWLAILLWFFCTPLPFSMAYPLPKTRNSTISRAHSTASVPTLDGVQRAVMMAFIRCLVWYPRHHLCISTAAAISVCPSRCLITCWKNQRHGTHIRVVVFEASLPFYDRFRILPRRTLDLRLPETAHPSKEP